MTNYKLLSGGSIQRLSDMACIPPDPANRDYAEFLAWADAGNTPDPADPIAPSEPRLVPRRTIIDRLHVAGKLDAALQVLNSQDAYTQQRWKSRDAIYFNDPTLLAALAAIGADSNVIMAEG